MMPRYIDADALLERSQAHSICGGIRNGKSLLTACNNYLWLYVNDAPTADVAPVVHGHYVFDDDGDSSCSVCREKYLDHTQKYCPNCGAKLDGEDGESDGTKS